jgi:hypothetical protein
MQLVAISWVVLDLVVAAGGGSGLGFRGWIISSGFIGVVPHFLVGNGENLGIFLNFQISQHSLCVLCCLYSVLR